MRVKTAKTGAVLVAAIVMGAALGAQAPTNSSATANSITVTGCIAAGPNNTFTLSAPAPSSEAPTGTTATTPAGSKVVKTVTYTLTSAKPDELKPHVGHTVQVTGAESAPEATVQSTERSAGAATTGTSGANPSGSNPTVQTTAQTQIVVRQLAVSSLKMVSANCTLAK